MTNQMARNVSGEPTSTVYACAYQLTPNYTSNVNQYPRSPRHHLLFWNLLINGFPRVSIVEVDCLSTLFGSSLLPAHMLLVESQWL